jgi:hypothetical protein
MATTKRGGLDRAAGALAVADTVAHAAFLALFGWRSLTSFGPLRFVAGVFAVLALVGLVLSFVGGLLTKYGRRTPAAKVGYWAIAGSTGLAGALLLFASWTG